MHVTARIFLCLCPSLLVVLLVDLGPLHAELQPSHVAILANTNNRDSLAVARHYAEQRRIPLSHIIRLALPEREHLTRDEYEKLVVLPVRQALRQAGLASTIRVLVTTYGVPLRVAAPILSIDEKRWLAEAQAWVKTSRAGLEDLRLQFERITPGTAAPGTIPAPTEQDFPETIRTRIFLSHVEQSLNGTLEHRPSSDAPASPQEMQELLQLLYRYGGWGRLLQKAKPAEDRPDIAAWRLLLQQTNPLWDGIGRSPITTQRSLIYRWAERLFGLRGVLELASAETDLLTMTRADASLDSELSLLWLDRELAPIAWRYPNPLFAGGADAQTLPILMVSRLDGPTADVAIHLVDKALRAEREGLQGTIYLDARGLPLKNPIDAYSHYDQSLRDAADLIRQHSDYRVVLENTDKRFSRPGQAPDVALYIGWYRLRAYEDAFTFNPGAIGYHMASAEAISVHDRRERGWCKNALDRGITSTLGSVGEPYLDAFPEPAEFVKLLLTGKYSLVETYYLNSRYLSWRMVLFGDPLYNPMRGRGSDTLESKDQLPIAPSERPMGEPIGHVRRLKQERESRMAQLVQVLQKAEVAAKPTH
ncbi:MAG: TIGR03790 family protein [Nitrospira sp.]|nr:TIGR03790 family protein [Nitrospira sp.]